MSWNQIQTLFDGQGLIFWAALAAVALGLTLLSVSIFFQVRKMLANSGYLKRRQAAKAARAIESEVSAAVEIQAPRITVTDDGYQAEGFIPTAIPAATPAAVAPATSAPVASDPRLAGLLTRLKSSADRLDRIHGSLGHNGARPQAVADSLLKGISEDVDYVYKTGRA